MNDLFSDLDDLPVPPTPPARPAVPNLADGLRSAGLLSHPPSVDPEPYSVIEPEADEVVEAVLEPEPVPVYEPTVEDVYVSAVPEEAFQLFTDGEVMAAGELSPEPEVEVDVDVDVASEVMPEPELQSGPEPVASFASTLVIASPTVEALPEASSRSAPGRRWYRGGGAVVLAVSVIGWLAYGSSNQESLPTPVPVPAQALEPVADEAPVVPLVVEPEAPAPVEVPAAPAMPEAPIAETKEVPAPAPEPTPAAPAKPSPKPVAKKPQSTKPAVQPAPKPTWQDDALDKLDDLEKRL
ncbi:hypothetical protein O0J73_07190 [Stenotrophomonas sp. Sm6012]|uniref:hypothetical protein n=1 Tax=Stenotrophomonas sp. Sm6012 TaxID=3002745 RepID=UPI0027E47260|nr:hypothetical protein [Stenotrophomonas sp. Sm6012]MDQ7280516.1 hypothetical protein [Stenotrophomonas sp. Sm6012]